MPRDSAAQHLPCGILQQLFSYVGARNQCNYSTDGTVLLPYDNPSLIPSLYVCRSWRHMARLALYESALVRIATDDFCLDDGANILYLEKVVGRSARECVREIHVLVDVHKLTEQWCAGSVLPMDLLTGFGSFPLVRRVCIVFALEHISSSPVNGVDTDRDRRRFWISMNMGVLAKHIRHMAPRVHHLEIYNGISRDLEGFLLALSADVLSEQWHLATLQPTRLVLTPGVVTENFVCQIPPGQLQQLTVANLWVYTGTQLIQRNRESLRYLRVCSARPHMLLGLMYRERDGRVEEVVYPVLEYLRIGIDEGRASGGGGEESEVVPSWDPFPGLRVVLSEGGLPLSVLDVLSRGEGHLQRVELELEQEQLTALKRTRMLARRGFKNATRVVVTVDEERVDNSALGLGP
ncbi:hypothetical protein GGF46_003352 [Coemansia sp. RSA 552]|nr:hypothetical protein GGF46_003352 [Coemansia sp. RSA 552]